MSEKVTIVVARYNEDLKWQLEHPFHLFNYIVYNKGSNDDFEKTYVKKIISLENVGRNDHTYLYHIITNYDNDNLSDIVVFFPGSLDMAEKKRKAINILNNIIDSNFSNAYFIGYYSENLKEEFKYFHKNNHSSHHEKNYNENPENLLYPCVTRPYHNWYDYFFQDTPAHIFTFHGIFSIDKCDIIQHPLTKYQLLILTLEVHSNPEAGHYLERSWGAVFYPMTHTKRIKIIENKNPNTNPNHLQSDV